MNREYFGFYPEAIKEVGLLTDFFSLPKPVTNVLGLMKVRGSIISLIDMWKFLGVPASEVNEASQVIVFEAEQFTVGVVVDEIFDIVAFSEENFAPNPLITKKEYIKSTIHYQNSILGVLDLKEILKAIMNNARSLKEKSH